MTMYYTHLPSPVGPFLLAGDGERLAIASFSTGRQVRRPQIEWIEDPVAMRFASEQLEGYFAGERQAFDLPLAVRGTEFQRAVWDVLRTVPFGEAWSYGRVAAAVGRPEAFRAVGSANAANVLPIVIPCHRVIGADGRLIGFGGGLETKRRLLRLEGALPEEQCRLF